MSFRLFGVHVEIQVSFWIVALLLGLRRTVDPELPRGTAVAIWVAVVFVSVLLHELGHAFAMKRYGIEPSITLYALGGLTHNRSEIPLRRRDDVIISLAGPFAGFLLGGIIFAAARFFPHAFERLTPAGVFAVGSLLWVNVGWGLVNLMPVLPLDGGHVLEAALGPKRKQLTAAISTLVGFLVAALFLQRKLLWGALIFGFAAVQSYRRFAAGGEEAEAEGEPPPRPEPLPQELAALLQAARAALAEEDLERAASLAQDVLDASTRPGGSEAPPAARREALEVIAWTHLLGDRLESAVATLPLIRKLGEPDPALTGAVLFARDDLAGARRVLEGARAAGDDRKQVIAPLVQILIAQGEAGRAAEVALAVVDSLSTEDARRMASIACEHAAAQRNARDRSEIFSTAAGLYLAMFDRLHQPEDAYEAARAEAQAGRPERALDMLRRAVEAGFSDRARGWSDAALATLQGGPVTMEGAPMPPAALEAVLGPRP